MPAAHHRGRTRLAKVMVALIVAGSVCVGCGSDDSRRRGGPKPEAPAEPSGDVRDGFLVGHRVSADRWLYEMCSMVLNSRPPKCGSSSTTVDGLPAPAELDVLVAEGDDAWTEEPVSISGHVGQCGNEMGCFIAEGSRISLAKSEVDREDGPIVDAERVASCDGFEAAGSASRLPELATSDGVAVFDMPGRGPMTVAVLPDRPSASTFRAFFPASDEVSGTVIEVRGNVMVRMHDGTVFDAPSAAQKDRLDDCLRRAATEREDGGAYEACEPGPNTAGGLAVRGAHCDEARRVQLLDRMGRRDPPGYRVLAMPICCSLVANYARRGDDEVIYVTG